MKAETLFQERMKDRLNFLKLVGDTQLVRVVTQEVTVVQPLLKKETEITSLIKSKALEDDFLRDIIPTKKDPDALEKLWASGKDLFKSREDIFKDEWVE